MPETLSAVQRPNDSHHTEESDHDRGVHRYTVSSLCKTFTSQRPVVINGLLREGETANIVSASKVGKSWLGYDLALSIITGSDWLGEFRCTPGHVILVDNELHPETLANRIPTVGDAKNLKRATYEHDFEVWPLRGRIKSLPELMAEFDKIQPGSVRAIILDAKYRFITQGTSENDNAAETLFYNQVDQIAAKTKAAIVMIHHSSKGGQADKRVSDVGAGAGAQSRAADCHLVLREHAEPDHIVLDAVVRTFEKPKPLTLRWAFPLWVPAPNVDPAILKGGKPTNVRQQDADREGAMKIVTVLKAAPLTNKKIQAATGLSKVRVDRLLFQLEESGQIESHPVTIRGNETEQYQLKDVVDE